MTTVDINYTLAEKSGGSYVPPPSSDEPVLEAYSNYDPDQYVDESSDLDEQAKLLQEHVENAFATFPPTTDYEIDVTSGVDSNWNLSTSAWDPMTAGASRAYPLLLPGSNESTPATARLFLIVRTDNVQ